ncbi:SprT-like domain-containing protein [Clostridium tarantellae]|uniref:SprT-like domain-containing protein n=1 Tax=Clostridium tarantellae TaxID=39493 RepID=A0A6I1MUZ6_9CLOT|nr:SprT-like domain-containing protein [Clostridium tarantellae]MPQ44029.1 hypothetical protein [Clostridium tarantellae]
MKLYCKGMIRMNKKIDLLELVKECERITNIKLEVPLLINKRLKKSLGITRYTIIKQGRQSKIKPKSIELNDRFLKTATKEEVKEVIRHEYAHYCALKQVGRHNHTDYIFKLWCKRLGVSNKATMEVKGLQSNKEKYTAYCVHCNKRVGGCKTSRHNLVKKTNLFKTKCCYAPVRILQNY